MKVRTLLRVVYCVDDGHFSAIGSRVAGSLLFGVLPVQKSMCGIELEFFGDAGCHFWSVYFDA